MLPPTYQLSFFRPSRTRVRGVRGAQRPFGAAPTLSPAAPTAAPQRPRRSPQHHRHRTHSAHYAHEERARESSNKSPSVLHTSVRYQAAGGDVWLTEPPHRNPDPPDAGRAARRAGHAQVGPQHPGSGRLGPEAAVLASVWQAPRHPRPGHPRKTRQTGDVHGQLRTCRDESPLRPKPSSR